MVGALRVLMVVKMMSGRGGKCLRRFLCASVVCVSLQSDQLKNRYVCVLLRG